MLPRSQIVAEIFHVLWKTRSLLRIYVSALSLSPTPEWQTFLYSSECSPAVSLHRANSRTPLIRCVLAGRRTDDVKVSVDTVAYGSNWTAQTPELSYL